MYDHEALECMQKLRDRESGVLDKIQKKWSNIEEVDRNKGEI